MHGSYTVNFASSKERALSIALLQIRMFIRSSIALILLLASQKLVTTSQYRSTKILFDAEGKHPVVNDQRVSFILGLFQDTLLAFLQTFTCGHRLVIHNDSDL